MSLVDTPISPKKKIIGENITQGLLFWWKIYKKSKIGVFGLALFSIMLLLIVLAPVIATHNPKEMLPDILASPSTHYFLGTNSVGQDVFSQLFYAGRMSLLIGFVTGTIVIIIATFVGLVAGYFGGLIDEILMRIADIFLILPRLPLLIVMAALLGPGIPNMILVISVIGWTGVARQIRALTLSLREYPYIESAKATGASDIRIITRHILPNVAGIIIANYVMEIVSVILLETGLSFLGFGDPLRPSWGQMLYFAQVNGAFSFGAWWWWLSPGLCLTLVCCSMSFIGISLNDRFVLRLSSGGRR